LASLAEVHFDATLTSADIEHVADIADMAYSTYPRYAHSIYHMYVYIYIHTCGIYPMYVNIYRHVACP